MSSLDERYRRILEHPLDYLHPQRLDLGRLDSPAVRAALTPLLVDALALPKAQPLPAHGPWLATWLQHWRRLPRVARLLAAYLHGGQLARGAAIARLPPGERRFVACACGTRAPLQPVIGAGLQDTLAAHGLRILLGWHERIPAALLSVLPLQFSPTVAALAERLPAQADHSRLFILAVQHARHSAQLA